MGLTKKISSSCYDTNNKLPNPSPFNYIITGHRQMGNYLVIFINYPDCKNYEGNKLLVYKDITIDMLRKQESIDPHFSNSKDFYSPVARLQPSDFGMKLAMRMIKGQNND